MALTKVTYVDNQTVITAQNLNDIQDSIINLENDDGSSLPAFTSADNGKFLRISNNQAVWVAISDAESQVF